MTSYLFWALLWNMCKLGRDLTNNSALTKPLSDTENTKHYLKYMKWWSKELMNPQEVSSLHREIREGRFTSTFLWPNPQMKINWKSPGTTNRTMFLWCQEFVLPFVLCMLPWNTSAAVSTRRNNFIPCIYLGHNLKLKQFIVLFFCTGPFHCFLHGNASTWGHSTDTFVRDSPQRFP